MILTKALMHDKQEKKWRLINYQNQVTSVYQLQMIKPLVKLRKNVMESPVTANLHNVLNSTVSALKMGVTAERIANVKNAKTTNATLTEKIF